MIEINDKEKFVDKLMSKLLENGFDFVQQREMKVYILYLLIEDGQFIKENGDIDHHEISLALKISESKVRNLVYDMELKYRQNFNFSEQLIELIERNKYEVTKNKIKFSVHNPLLKQFFEYEIRNLNGVSDGSFAKHIVTISINTFEKLLIKLIKDETKVNNIIKSLPKNLKEKITDKESLVKEFVHEFVQTIISTSIERATNLLFDVIDPVTLLKKLLL